MQREPKCEQGMRAVIVTGSHRVPVTIYQKEEQIEHLIPVVHARPKGKRYISSAEILRSPQFEIVERGRIARARLNRSRAHRERPYRVELFIDRKPSMSFDAYVMHRRANGRRGLLIRGMVHVHWSGPGVVEVPK